MLIAISRVADSAKKDFVKAKSFFLFKTLIFVPKTAILRDFNVYMLNLTSVKHLSKTEKRL